MPDKCSNCGGHGLVLGNAGEPDDCRECGGTAWMRKRNSKGRFVKEDDGQPDEQQEWHDYDPDC